MAQVTLYLDDEIARKLAQAAEAAGVSRSRWVARLLEAKLADEWPAPVRELLGSWPDFPSLDEIRQGVPEDLPREPL